MPDYSNVPDATVNNEKRVDEAIDAQMRRTSDAGAIADLAAASGTYVQAEATATRTTINSILAVLRDAELIP